MRQASIGRASPSRSADRPRPACRSLIAGVRGSCDRTDWLETLRAGREGSSYEIDHRLENEHLATERIENVIVEERTYTLNTGKVPEYLRLYGEEGRAIQEPLLGHMVGWFTANDIGELNQVVHMWA